MAGFTATEQFSASHRKSIPLVGDGSELCEAGSRFVNVLGEQSDSRDRRTFTNS